mmetsp:Transcript_8819/g.36459  ORF Transcript_8819/g.36459 Transcript_8819/m.36459 type:complete len:526 (+) Transcript_8819:170-1747(+)
MSRDNLDGPCQRRRRRRGARGGAAAPHAAAVPGGRRAEARGGGRCGLEPSVRAPDGRRQDGGRRGTRARVGGAGVADARHRAPQGDLRSDGGPAADRGRRARGAQCRDACQRSGRVARAGRSRRPHRARDAADGDETAPVAARETRRVAELAVGVGRCCGATTTRRCGARGGISEDEGRRRRRRRRRQEGGDREGRHRRRQAQATRRVRPRRRRRGAPRDGVDVPVAPRGARGRRADARRDGDAVQAQRDGSGGRLRRARRGALGAPAHARRLPGAAAAPRPAGHRDVGRRDSADDGRLRHARPVARGAGRERERRRPRHGAPRRPPRRRLRRRRRALEIARGGAQEAGRRGGPRRRHDQGGGPSEDHRAVSRRRRPRHLQLRDRHRGLRRARLLGDHLGPPDALAGPLHPDGRPRAPAPRGQVGLPLLRLRGHARDPRRHHRPGRVRPPHGVARAERRSRGPACRRPRAAGAPRDRVPQPDGPPQVRHRRDRRVSRRRRGGVDDHDNDADRPAAQRPAHRRVLG